MDEWFLVSYPASTYAIHLTTILNQERNLQYVVQVELYLEGIFGSDRGDLSDLDEVYVDLRGGLSILSTLLI